MNLRILIVITATALWLTPLAETRDEQEINDSTSVKSVTTADKDSLFTASYTKLTEEDYQWAAKELNIEAAAIKAVVLIEAGHKLQGFHAPGVPLINFDLTMFTRAAKRRRVNLNKFHKTHSVVFAKPDKKRYGSYQEAQQARLVSAMSIDSISAIEGTFWGMFQIGGFNWKKCGAKSHFDFVDRMSRSETEQLKLFVNFIKSNKLEKYLQKKDWASFARIYNGPSYRKRNYHTRMATAYRNFSKNP